mmetsp:Transcript_36819/g.41568  ORF Transcript_36819/g.41568 Transcript_36819/m.41568 type:complete len:131 (-) Transcript_36819:38-430(-)
MPNCCAGMNLESVVEFALPNRTFSRQIFLQVLSITTSPHKSITSNNQSHITNYTAYLPFISSSSQAFISRFPLKPSSQVYLSSPSQAKARFKTNSSSLSSPTQVQVLLKYIHQVHHIILLWLLLLPICCW